MKKCLCLLLCLALCVAAAPAVLAAAPVAKRLSFCDTAMDWINGAASCTTLSADGDLFTEGPTSLRVTGDLTKGGNMVIYLRSFAPIDVSDCQYLEFDLYTEDRDVLATGAGQIELSSAGQCDVAELAFLTGAMVNQIVKNGWNHIRLPLAEAGRNSSDSTRVYDPTAVNYFRMYMLNMSSEKSSYFFCVDNMYFSDGVSKPQDAPTPSGYEPAAAGTYQTVRCGDMTGDGGVNAVDALGVLQYAVGKLRPANRQLAACDVNGDGAINAVDALDILRFAVYKLDRFAAAGADTAGKTVEVGLNEPHLVHPQFTADQAIIAEIDVIYWGARGDGVTDDTLAFQKAIAAAEARQGGTVFVPAGRYVIKGNLFLPNGVTLQGDAPAVTVGGPAQGTVLMAYAGRGNENGTAFIRMDSSSALANVTIWYPEQTAANITPYPWTLQQAGHYGISVTNVRLVNSYKGLVMGPGTNSLQNIRNVVGTPLKMGLILDYNVDICRVENVYFTPEVWLSSGLGDPAAGEAQMRSFIYQNGTAFKFESVDWTYIADIGADGYHVALGNSKPTMRDADGSPNGHVYNVDFRNCYIGYDAQFVNPIGMMITKGTIQAVIPVYTDGAFSTSVSLNRLTLEATGNAAVVQSGTGVLTLADCLLRTAGGTGVSVTGGTLSASHVTFENCATHVFAGNGAKAILTNCMTRDTLVTSGGGAFTTTWNTLLKTASYDPDAYDYNARAVIKPAGDAFVDLTRAPYNATQSGDDIGPALRQALADVQAAGGGVVYLPSGRYRLESPVSVPTGVELRGSCTFPQHSHAYSTTLYTDYGRNGAADDTALITLRPNAGIAGFKVYYDLQEGNSPNCTPYAFSARGAGFNDYILNVNFINSFYQTDFASHRCDGHYINGATGFPLQQGIVVGGGSVNGIVRDCQFNVHYFGDNPYYRSATEIGDYRQYATDNSEAFVVQQTTHQTMYHNFVLGVHSGIAIDSGADVFVLAHGTDGGDRSMTVRGTPSGKVTFVNTQLVVIGPGATMAYVNIEPSFTGTVDMIQTNTWGIPTTCSFLVGGGTLNYTQGTNVRSGLNGFKVFNGANLNLDTVNHMRSDVAYDLQLRGSGAVTTFGNIYASGGKLSDPSNVYCGVDLRR